ncbi:MAG: hypothetical protein P8L41_03720, partial [Paracoccaceae bacterium]|nr:hypothetical protein [Paracoccaceae bacterium]
FDIFGYSEERKIERGLIRQYEQDLKRILTLYTAVTKPAIIELAMLPLSIKGFGPVKLENYKKASAKRKSLLASIDETTLGLTQAAE